jgi:predicted nucleic acid-binding protein
VSWLAQNHYFWRRSIRHFHTGLECVFPDASTHPEVFGFCENLLSQPHCQIIEPRERHWDIFKRLCVETNTRGNTVTDAWYAALAIEWGCEWITLDRDFARFPGLRWRPPQAA